MPKGGISKNQPNCLRASFADANRFLLLVAAACVLPGVAKLKLKDSGRKYTVI
jgi:hypothetical protein